MLLAPFPARLAVLLQHLQMEYLRQTNHHALRVSVSVNMNLQRFHPWPGIVVLAAMACTDIGVPAGGEQAADSLGFTFDGSTEHADADAAGVKDVVGAEEFFVDVPRGEETDAAEVAPDAVTDAGTDGLLDVPPPADVTDLVDVPDVPSVPDVIADVPEPVDVADEPTPDAEEVADDAAIDVAVDVPDAPTDLSAADFGKPCSNNADCTSGFCISTAKGDVCTELCLTSCPNDWRCAQIASSTGTVSICKPRFDTLCDPCGVDADCNLAGGLDNVCLGYGGKGSFCGAICQPTKKDCPDGYSCEEATDPITGDNSYQCIPTSGQCTCSAAAIQKQAFTVCWKTNVLGKCIGGRSCGAFGLSECSAKLPEEETCNGIDDDCNGFTDEGLGAVKCSKANSFGVCFGDSTGCVKGQSTCNAKTPAAESCNGIDDDCNGQTDDVSCDDGNVCSTDSCAGKNGCQHTGSGLACDDGSVCTLADACTGTTCVGGNFQDCSDSNPCTIDSCDGVKGCVYVPASDTTTCADDSDPCTADLCDGSGTCAHLPGQGLCKINGQCVSAGSLNPVDPCQVCAPTISTSAYTSKNGLPCDDGDLCTVDDKCTSDVCAGAPMDCSSKAGQCTKAVCDQGICVVTPKAALCDDGEPCTQNDVCVGGVCKGTLKDCSNLDSTCFIGACHLGNCSQTPKLGSCDDGDPCTLGDTCAGGGCKGTPIDCSAENSVCGSATCEGGVCKIKPNPGGTNCDDGNDCTTGDVCESGICVGLPKDCTGMDGVCVKGTCSLGQCYAKVQTGACNDGDPCTVNDACSGQSCVGSAMDCSANNSGCGISVCQSGTCTKPVGGECTPGQVDKQSEGCGNCGNHTRTRGCTDGCTWGAWSDWGSCDSQGECSPNAQQNTTCGNCGTASRTCNGSCQWGGWSGCNGQGPCAPSQTQACGDGSANCTHQTCSNTCQWGGCELNAGAQCTWNSGTHYQCCSPPSPHGWQFCNNACHWNSCAKQTSGAYACP